MDTWKKIKFELEALVLISNPNIIRLFEVKPKRKTVHNIITRMFVKFFVKNDGSQGERKFAISDWLDVPFLNHSLTTHYLLVYEIQRRQRWETRFKEKL